MRRSREAAVLSFFRDAPLPVVEVVYGLVQDVMRERKKERREADRVIGEATKVGRKLKSRIQDAPVLAPPPGVLP